MKALDRIRHFADGTRTRVEVAALAGVNPRHMGSYVYRAVEKGIELRFKPSHDPADFQYVRVDRMLEIDPTLTAEQIGMLIGITTDQAREAARRARERGIVVRPAPTHRGESFDTMLTRGHIKAGGGVAQLMRGLPVEAQMWVIGQIPEGATCADVIRAIVVDAFNEERDGRA